MNYLSSVDNLIDPRWKKNGGAHVLEAGSWDFDIVDILFWIAFCVRGVWLQNKIGLASGVSLWNFWSDRKPYDSTLGFYLGMCCLQDEMWFFLLGNQWSQYHCKWPWKLVANTLPSTCSIFHKDSFGKSNFANILAVSSRFWRLRRRQFRPKG
jgi:hypothetical protein